MFQYLHTHNAETRRFRNGTILNPATESLAIYARLNPSDYVAWTSKALLQRTDSTTTWRLPCAIDNDVLIASFADAESYLDRADGSTSSVNLA